MLNVEVSNIDQKRHADTGVSPDELHMMHVRTRGNSEWLSILLPSKADESRR